MSIKENPNNVNSSSYIKKKNNANIEKDNLKLIHWNWNSLNNKIEEFKSFCLKFNPQVISLNETKMSEFNAQYILNINNYTTIHKARNYKKNGGGGVALLVRKDIKFSECRLFDSLDLEICAINLSINGKETCIITYYNPPNLKLSEEVFHILRKKCAEYVIMGDLNAKATLWCSDKNNDSGDILDNIILDNDCIIANSKEPTHKNFNGKTTSILDYIIISTKLFDYVEDCTVLSNEDMTSDHFPISLKLSLKRTISKNNNIYQHSIKFKKYNFEKANWDGFKSALPTAVDSKIGDNVDKLEEFIKHSLIKASDQFIPIFTKVIKSKQLPKHILELIKARKTARKIADKDPDCKSAKKLYNKLTETIREENRAACCKILLLKIV